MGRVFTRKGGQAAATAAPKAPLTQRVREGAARAWDTTKAQFSGKNWAEAGRGARDLATKPVQTARQAWGNMGKLDKALLFGFPGAEAARIAVQGRDTGGAKKEMLEREFGQGATKVYDDARRKSNEAIYGTGSQAMGAAVGAELGALAGYARKTRALPLVGLAIGGSMIGQAAGGVMDRIRGKKPMGFREGQQAAQQFQGINQVVEARRRQLQQQQAQQQAQRRQVT